MKSRFFLTILYTLIIIGVLNSSYGKSKNFNYNAKNVSNYFSALISFDEADYQKSQKFFKKIQDIEKNNTSHTPSYIRSLVNLQKYTEAEQYSRKLEINKNSNFESKLILGLYEFKRGNGSKARIYFNELKPSIDHRLVFNVLKISLENWAGISKSKKDGISSIENMPKRYESFKIIQKALVNCFYDTAETKNIFSKILENKDDNFSRYYFFYGNYLLNRGNKSEALDMINEASKKNPKNLLINQLKKTINQNEKNRNKFDCNNKNHILAEIFYIIANALSTQGMYELSNFYINLSKYLNPHFLSYNSLLAENYFILKKYKKSKKVFNELSNYGSVYKWYANRQIAFILDDQKKEEEAILFLKKNYQRIEPDIYQTFDYANFLKDRKKYEDAIKLYSKILLKIKKDHKLYPQVLAHAVNSRRMDDIEFSGGDQQSLQLLENQLDSERPDEVVYSLNLLHQARPKRLREHYSHLLVHSSSSVRHTIIEIIARDLKAEATPQLLEALENEASPGVQATILRSIAKSDPESSHDILLPYLQVEHARLLLAALVSLIKYGGLRSILAAGGRLQELEKSSVPTERAMAAQAIGDIQNPSFYHGLEKLLQDGHLLVRQTALEAAGELGAPQLLQPTLEALSEPQLESVALKALRQSGPDSLEALWTAYHQDGQSYRIQRHIIVLLGNMKNAKCNERLFNLLHSQASELQEEILYALRASDFKAQTRHLELMDQRINQEGKKAILYKM